jgi:hypothetical protein
LDIHLSYVAAKLSLSQGAGPLGHNERLPRLVATVRRRIPIANRGFHFRRLGVQEKAGCQRITKAFSSGDLESLKPLISFPRKFPF